MISEEIVKIRRLTAKILHRQEHLIDGCRELNSEWGSIGLPQIEPIGLVIGFDSLTDHLPRGAFRSHCADRFLATADKEAKDWVAQWEGEIFEALQQINKYLDHYEQDTEI